MYVHLGQDYIVPSASIIAILDMDTATTSKYTRQLIARMEQEGQIISLFEDLPHTAILCESALGERLYLSQISSTALAQRVERAERHAFS